MCRTATLFRIKNINRKIEESNIGEIPLSMSHIFGKKTLKTKELFGVPLQTCLAYTVNILFKFIWGLRNISKNKKFPCKLRLFYFIFVYIVVVMHITPSIVTIVVYTEQ